MKHQKNKHALAFIFITVLLDMLALGLIIPILPGLIVGLAGGDKVRGALVVGLFGTVFALMQFVFSPVLGSLSDRFGRRPVILLSNLGMGLDYLVMALAPTLGWLFVGRVLSGLTASSVGTAFAYIADSTTPKTRAAGFGVLGAAFSLGFVVGPGLGGWLGGMGPRLPFWAAAGLSLVNFLYGFLVLPESLRASRRSAFQWKKANPVGSLQLLRSHAELSGLAWIYFLNSLAHGVFTSVFVLYVGYRYHWGPPLVGFCLMLVGLATGTVQGGLIRPVVRRFGEKRALLAGLGFGLLGFLVFGWAPTGGLFNWGIPLSALWGLAGSPLQSLMSQRVGRSIQGQLQGANGSLRAIAELIAPGLFTSIYAFFITPGRALQLPGSAFFLAAFLLVLAGIGAWNVKTPGPGKTKEAR
ncbi:MAG TPA: TCR/Tet family MFS transporter [bacterium]|nr:TCR/Tet family MFS transporter [bacterium]